MKTTTIYVLLLLGFNASTVSAQDAAPRVLRGSPQIVAFEDYVKDSAQESQCFGTGRVCAASSQCCPGMICSANLCRPDCGPRGNFCTSGSQCCSGRCSGFLCTRP